MISYNNLNSTSVLFSGGVKANGEFSFSSPYDKSDAILKIVKQETVELTYKVAIAYMGLDRDRRPGWKIELYDRLNQPSTHEFAGSRQFVIKPSTSSAIEIEETDENASCKVWVDMSKSSSMRVLSLNPPIPADTGKTVENQIQVLIEKAKISKSKDEKTEEANLTETYQIPQLNTLTVNVGDINTKEGCGLFRVQDGRYFYFPVAFEEAKEGTLINMWDGNRWEEVLIEKTEGKPKHGYRWPLSNGVEISYDLFNGIGKLKHLNTEKSFNYVEINPSLKKELRIVTTDELDPFDKVIWG